MGKQNRGTFSRAAALALAAGAVLGMAAFGQDKAPSPPPKAASAKAKAAAGSPKPVAAPAKPAAPKPAAKAAVKKPAEKPIPPAGELLARALAGPMRACQEVIFVLRGLGEDPHWYANFAYWSSDPQKAMYAGGGARLCRLNLKTLQVTVLLDDPSGSLRDPAVHYDGRTVLLSYRKGGTGHYNLHEMDALAAEPAATMKQVTFGEFDDIEPCWLPDLPAEAPGAMPADAKAGGDIVFCSSRCNRWVQCWHTQVAVLYRSGRDGSHMRPISSNVEHDNTPAVLPDGRILYTRWEYVDRSQVDFHHLWTINPDGTGQMTFYGNMNPRMVMIDAVPIPRSREVAAIFSPGHGQKEHVGSLMVLDADAGPDAQAAARQVFGCPRNVRDPYPFGGGCFLVARGRDLLLVDGNAGSAEVLYSLGPDEKARGWEVHEPRGLIPRPRERTIAPRSDPAQATGRMILADVTRGRNMDGVRPGEIRKLLILESLPKPVNFSGGPEPLSYLGTFTLERVLGTVPVEADGSAYFELPAHRPVFFVALDANDLSVKRMHSFVSVMPGETTGCVGCHEMRNEASVPRRDLAALRRPPSRAEPFEGFPDVPDFPRDIQPILDRHCVGCHDYRKTDRGGPRAGGLILAGDRGYRYSHSFWMLVAHGMLADGRNAFGNVPPRSEGSAANDLLRRLGPPPAQRTASRPGRVSADEWRTVWLWLESSAPYAGTYASLGCGAVHVDLWGAGGGAMGRRCGACHGPSQEDGTPPKDKVPLPAGKFARGPAGAPYERFLGKDRAAAARGSHILSNLTRPEMSPVLLAPLARSAGGWADGNQPLKAPGDPHHVVFQTTADADYQTILAAIRRAKAELDAIKRFDMPGFRPNEHYVREMKRYGILPAAFDPAADPIDCYAVDRAYWKSFWYTPPGR